MPDVAFWMRVGSAALFVLLGLAVAAVGRTRRGPLLLAAFLILTGATNIMTNVRQWTARDGDAVSVAQYVTEMLLLAGFSVIAPFLAREVPSPSCGWRPVLAGMAVGALCCVGYLDLAPEQVRAVGSPGGVTELRMLTLTLYVVGIVALVVTSSLRIAIDPPRSRTQWLRSLALLGLFGPYLLLFWPARFGDPTSEWTLVSMVVLLAGMTIPPLVAAAKTRDRRLVWLGLAWPALGMLSYLYLLVPSTQPGTWDPWGMYGVARVLGWSILVYVIIKGGLLDVPLPNVAVSRGTVAAGALATLFIVAQIAQNFFSAEYGLLTGGVVAGTFLFAASPVQRAMERVGARSPAGLPRTQRGPEAKAGKHQEAAFRDAVRLAWKDRRFDQAEEVTLANLADSMGLTAKRATEIRHEVEREKGAA